MSALGRRGLSAALAALAIGVGAWLLWPDSRPNVVWITVDSVRPDRLPAWGYSRSSTPSIDYLARGGVVFDRAFSDAPWTTAAAASAMTGRFAVHHSLRSRFTTLPESETTVAEILRAHGYDTKAIVGSFGLDHVFGLDQGFASYDDRYDSPMESFGASPHVPSAFFRNVDQQRSYLTRKRRADSYRSDSAVGAAAVAWLRRASRMRPFFLWVHFFGPHRREEHGRNSPADVAAEMAAYDGRVEALDEAIGAILGELHERGFLGRSIIVFQGDHGEGLGDHGETGHGDTLYDSVLRIPLVIQRADRSHPGRVASMVRGVDVAPTILALLGIPSPPGIDGRSLEPLLDGGVLREEPLLAETWRSTEGSLGMFHPDGSIAVPGIWRLGVRTPKWKYVRSEPRPFSNYSRPKPLPADADRYRGEELYDLAADPAEAVNVVGDHADVAADLGRMLQAIAPPGPAAP